MRTEKRMGGGKVRKGSFREDEMITISSVATSKAIEPVGLHDGDTRIVVNH